MTGSPKVSEKAASHAAFILNWIDFFGTKKNGNIHQMSSEGGTWARQTCGARRLKMAVMRVKACSFALCCCRYRRQFLLGSDCRISTRLTTCRIESSHLLLLRARLLKLRKHLSLEAYCATLNCHSAQIQ
jgi:hypothetical protein